MNETKLSGYIWGNQQHYHEQHESVFFFLVKDDNTEKAFVDPYVEQAVSEREIPKNPHQYTANVCVWIGTTRQ